MADNYLEKQYKSHEARRAAWEKVKKVRHCKAFKKKDSIRIYN